MARGLQAAPVLWGRSSTLSPHHGSPRSLGAPVLGKAVGPRAAPCALIPRRALPAPGGVLNKTACFISGRKHT